MAIVVGSVAVDVVPSAAQFWTRFVAQTRPGAQTAGEQIGRAVGTPIQNAIGNGLTEGIRRGARGAQDESARAGERVGGHFARTFRSRLEAALRNLPKIQPDADTAALDGKLARLKAELKAMSKQEIDFDTDTADVLAQITSMRAALEAIGRADVELHVESDIVAALAELEAIQESLRTLDAVSVEVDTSEADREVGLFARRLRQRIEAALRDLPDIRIEADSSQAERRLNAIRAGLATLVDRNIGVDLDVATALTRVEFLRERLLALDAETTDIRVRADIASAIAELEAVAQLADHVGRQNPNVRVDADTAAARANLASLQAHAIAASGTLRLLTFAGVALVPTLVPAFAAAAGAAAGLAATVATVTAGVGALGFGLFGVVGAVQAMVQADQQASRSAVSLSNSQASVAAAIDGVRFAQLSLANTRADIAERERRALRTIADAEQDLVQAQQRRLDVQGELNEAVKEATQALEDLQSKLTHADEDERQAVIRLAEAKEKLDRVKADPAALQRERDQTQLNYDKAVTELEDVRRRRKRLDAEFTEQFGRGIAQSKQVQAARERIADADDRVARAQQALADARHAADEQARQAAFQLLSAQRQVEQAQLAVQRASQSAGSAGGAAMDELRRKIAGLTPEGARFAEFVFGLRTQLTDIRHETERRMLPGLESGIRAVLPLMPGFVDFMGDMAGVLGDVAEEAGIALAGPWWRQFFDYVGTVAPPILRDFLHILGNLTVGLAGVQRGFQPVVDQIGGGLLGMSERFAHFGRTVETNPQFQRFIAYTLESGPRVVDTLGAIVRAVIRIGEGAAPVGSVLLSVLTGVSNFVAGLPVGVITVFVAAVTLASAALGIYALTAGVVHGAMVLVRGAQLLWNGAILAGTRSLGAMRTAMIAFTTTAAGPWTVVIAAATLAIGALILKHREQEAAADAAGDAMRAYAQTLRDGVNAESAAATQSILAQNKELRGLVATLRDAGVAQDTLARGLNGDVAARNQVVAAIDRQIEAENARARQAADEDPDTKRSRAHLKRAWELERLRDRFVEVNKENAESNALTDQAADSNDAAASAVDRYANAIDRARRALEENNKVAKDADRLTQDYEASIDRLTEALTASTGSLDQKTDAGRRSRDALRELIEASNAMLAADLAAGVPLEEAIKRHRERTAAIREETRRTGALTSEVDALIQTYGVIPEELVLRLLIEGVPLALDQLGKLGEELQDLMQRYGVDLQTAAAIAQRHRVDPQTRREDRRGTFASGGLVSGPGTATSDSIPAWLSDGEFVVPAKAVQSLGLSFMESIRQGRMPRFATGGLVRDSVTLTGAQDVTRLPVHKETLQILAAVAQAIPGLAAQGTPATVGAPDGASYPRIVALQNMSGIPFTVSSTYRPGSPDWHGRAMAVDSFSSASNMAGLASWLTRFTPFLLELIHSGGGGFYVKNGRRVSSSFYGPSVVSGHYDHVHTAMTNQGINQALAAATYDSGGDLPPGLTLAYNGTGRTESVITDQRFEQLRQEVSTGAGGGRSLLNIEHLHSGADPTALAYELDWISRHRGDG